MDRTIGSNFIRVCVFLQQHGSASRYYRPSLLVLR